MAIHFARGIPMGGHLVSARLLPSCHIEARDLPARHRTHFLAFRSLLAELMSVLYGTSTLSEIVTQVKGKPVFRDENLPGLSISYVGNIVGVVLITEGTCGLDMELQRTTRGLHNPNSMGTWRFSSNENPWINNQNDPDEAHTQLITLRQSALKLTGDVCNDDPRRLQLLPGVGRLKCVHVAQVEAICDAGDVLAWPIVVMPTIKKLRVWEFDGR